MKQLSTRRADPAAPPAFCFRENTDKGGNQTGQRRVLVINIRRRPDAQTAPCIECNAPASRNVSTEAASSVATSRSLFLPRKRIRRIRARNHGLLRRTNPGANPTLLQQSCRSADARTAAPGGTAAGGGPCARHRSSISAVSVPRVLQPFMHAFLGGDQVLGVWQYHLLGLQKRRHGLFVTSLRVRTIPSHTSPGSAGPGVLAR